MTTPTAPPPTDLAATLKQARKRRIQLARQSFGAFVELLLLDEESQQPIKLVDMHREWCSLVEQNDRAAIMAHFESGKSQILSIALPLWTLGRNPNARVLLLSNAHSQAAKVLRTIAKHIESNQRLHEIFPRLRPSQPWREDLLCIERGQGIKDPSVVSLGLHGALTGARVDLAVLDDVDDWESARTPTQRDNTWGWITSTVFSRLTAQSKVAAVGTPWHQQDTMNRLAALPGWKFRRFAVVDEEGNPRWPERWPLSRIQAQHGELGPYDFARMLLCTPVDDESALFKREWLRGAIDLGTGLLDGVYIPQPLPGCRYFIGVDPAVGMTSKHDLSAICGIQVFPNGSRQIMFCQAGRWPAIELMRRVAAAHQQFARARVVVETNAAQKFLAELLRDQGGVPVTGFTTGSGLKSLLYQAELFGKLLAQGKIIIPSRDGKPSTPELGALVGDLAAFVPTAHVPDRVAALLLANVGAGAPKAETGYLPPWFNNR